MNPTRTHLHGMPNVEAALPAQQPPPHEHGGLFALAWLRSFARLSHVLVLHTKQHGPQGEMQICKHLHGASRVFAVFVLYKARFGCYKNEIVSMDSRAVCALFSADCLVFWNHSQLSL